MVNCPAPDRFRLREPGGVDFLDQVSDGLGLEEGAVEPLLGPHDEHLVEGPDSPAIQSFTFCLSFYLAVLLFDCGDFTPYILQVPAYGTTIVMQREMMG